MSEWTKVSIKKEYVDSAFSETIAKSKKLPMGAHNDVRIVAVSPIPGKPGIIIEWENEAGLGMRQYVFSAFFDTQLGESKFSSVYIHFARAMCGDDMALYQDFFLNAYQNNPSILNNVKGLHANIFIGMPKKGAIIKKSGEQYCVADIQSGDILTDLQKDSGGMFNTYEDAKETAKQNNVRIEYNSVLGTYPNAGSVDANRKQLRNALQAARSASSTQGNKLKAAQVF